MTVWRQYTARIALPALRFARAVIRPFAPSTAGRFQILLMHGLLGEEDGFRALIEYTRTKHGVISPDEAARILAGNATNAGSMDGRLPCILSFDDGFASNFAVAHKVLKEMDLRALFFVCPGLTDMKGDDQQAAVVRNLFRAPVAGRSAPERLMAWDEIAELSDWGHTIGNHGLLHRPLSALSGGELDCEINEAADIIARRLGAPASWYAFAFGDIGSISAEALRVVRGRHRYCRSGVRGVNGPGVSPWALRAQQIPLDHTPYAQLILQGGLDGRYRAARGQLDAWAGSAG